jgi:predicted RNase H-like HicB family nuclease
MFTIMAKREFTVIIEQDEDGWLVSSGVELPGCHTQGKTLDELLANTTEAIQAYLGEEKEVDIHTRFIGVQKLEVPA